MRYLMLAVSLCSLLSFHYGITKLSLCLIEDDSKWETSELWKIAIINTCVSMLLLFSFLSFGIKMPQKWILLIGIVYVEGIWILELNKRSAIFLALISVMNGISAMVFYSALISIFWRMPLSYFSDSFSLDKPLKILPVILGYFSASYLLNKYSSEEERESIRYITETCKRMRFLLVSLSLSVIFLLIQFSLYIRLSDTWAAKFWSLGSCLYISIGYYFVFCYAVRIGRIYQMEIENRKMQEVLKNQEKEENVLQEALVYDGLTGVYSRFVGKQKVDEILEKEIPFHLCLIDLDGLKYVNDHFGHCAGDVYLYTVAKVLRQNRREDEDILFRYGGDEFVLIYVNCTEDIVLKRLEEAYTKLREESKTYQMSISYGVCSWQEGDTYYTLLTKADRRMYLMKRKHKEENPEFAIRDFR